VAKEKEHITDEQCNRELDGRERPRKVTIGSGTMQVTSPRVRDERVDADADRCRFTSETLPPYMRRSPKVAEEPVEKFVKEYDDKYPNAPQGYTALHLTTPQRICRSPISGSGYGRRSFGSG
jgi:hypothetical protein